MQLENYTAEELRLLQKQIDLQLAKKDDCNVATPVNLPISLFDSCNDELVTTVEIDNKILSDFQTLRNSPGEDIRKTLAALLDYYDSEESLNLILLSDVLETRQSYTKYTAQLANFLHTNQKAFRQVKVQFDSTTTRLGIFCRKGTETSTLNTTFLGTITAALRVYGSAQVDIKQIPMSYLGNRAALKHLLTHRLGHTPRLLWTRSGLSIFSE